MLESLINKVLGLKACNFLKKRLRHRCFPANIVKFLWTAFFNRTPLVAASEKYEYTLYMLDLLKDCYNCFLLSLIEKHLNEHILYYNFSFLGTYQVYYTILLVPFEFVFILKHIFCLPQWLFFQMACYFCRWQVYS